MKSLFALATGLVWAELILIEVILATPIDGRIYLAIAGGWLLLSWASLRFRRPSRGQRAAALILLAALAVLYWIPWSSRKPFLRSFSRIHAGMTAAEVDSVMEGYVRGSNLPKSLSFLHSNDGRFDSDVGIVYFQDETVERKEFLFD